MRSLEECQAEVFRRSEEKIKNRKRIWSRIVACCVPICCVAVGLFMVTQFVPIHSPVAESVWETTPEQTVDGSFTKGSLRVLCGEEQVISHFDADTLVKAEKMIYGLFETEEQVSAESVQSGQKYQGTVNAWEKNYGENLLGSAEYVYDIYLTNAQGMTTRYQLRGNLLRNMDHDATVYLSESERAALLELIELS